MERGNLCDCGSSGSSIGIGDMLENPVGEPPAVFYECKFFSIPERIFKNVPRRGAGMGVAVALASALAARAITRSPLPIW